MWYEKIKTREYLLIALNIIIFIALILITMGRVPYCKCGYVKLWHGDVWSSENSQHLTDWYTFSHIIHGFIFYWLLGKFGKKLPIGLRLVLAIIIEGSWEVLENSSLIINRYRESTLALDYFGDSVLNSVSDIFSMVFGFFLAYKLPSKVIVATLIFLELFTLYVIRDNLTLNIIMLLYPIDAIKNWQMAIFNFVK